MRRSSLLLLTSGISLVASQAVLAADLPARPPMQAQAQVMAAPFSWTGFYIGGHVGGSWAHVDWTHTNTGGTVERFNQESNSLLYGGHAGAMYQFGNIVVGIEGTYSRHDSHATSVAVLSADRSNAFAWDTTATIVGRLGMAWDRWLVYAQGGGATADVRFNRFITSTGSTTASSSGWDHGWTIGVGGAYAIHNNVIVGIDYNFVRIDLDNRVQTLAPGFAGIDSVTSARASQHQVTGRLSFKFP